MTTRKKLDAGALSQERYMSSNEFSELRGVSGIAVSYKVAVTIHKIRQNFLWWLQGQSLADGGLKRLARELLKAFPERIGTPRLHAFKGKTESVCPSELVDSVLHDLNLRSPLEFEIKSKPRKKSELISICESVAFTGQKLNSEYYMRIPTLEEFLIDLCVNPRVIFQAPGEKMDTADFEADLAIDQNPELSKDDFKNASVIYFHDIIGALFEFKEKQEAKIKSSFQLTAIGKKIWETLDYAHASNSMVVLDGLEGRGKTEAVKAWCDLHLGSARFVSLKGITSKTTAFREMAKALGIASSYTRTASEMQARIEDVLKRSKMMLVIDEAHFVFNQSQRMYSRPELVDWIDTAVCNRGVPIALVTTPQFIVCMTRAADQVEWNYRQFRRRVGRWVKLPESNIESDVRAVVRNVFKKASIEMVSKITGYAMVSKRDLSAVGDIAREVRFMLGHDDLEQATLAQVHSAIYDHLMASDKTFLEGMDAVRNPGRKPRQKPVSGSSFMEAPAQREVEPVSRIPRVDSNAPHTRLGSEFKAPLIEA